MASRPAVTTGQFPQRRETDNEARLRARHCAEQRSARERQTEQLNAYLRSLKEVRHAA